MKAYWGSGGRVPCNPDLGTRWTWVVSFTLLSLYPQRKSPWYPLDRRLGGPQSRSGRGGEEKNSQPPPGLETSVWVSFHLNLSTIPPLWMQRPLSWMVYDTSLTPWCRFEELRVNQLVKQEPFFTEPEGSLPWSQKPDTGLYPKPTELSSPHPSLSP
jgi:hypothetical protein